jgi:hypothetical protein
MTTTRETAMSASEELIARLNAGHEERLERVRLAAAEKERDEDRNNEDERTPSASERQVAALAQSQVRPEGRASQIQAEMLGNSN